MVFPISLSMGEWLREVGVGNREWNQVREGATTPAQAADDWQGVSGRSGKALQAPWKQLAAALWAANP